MIRGSEEKKAKKKITKYSLYLQGNFVILRISSLGLTFIEQ
jgi:hypothetical protein